jgi:hypothetical protein
MILIGCGTGVAVGSGVKVAVGSSVAVWVGVSVAGMDVFVGNGGGASAAQPVIATESVRNTSKIFFIFSPWNAALCTVVL